MARTRPKHYAPGERAKRGRAKSRARVKAERGIKSIKQQRGNERAALRKEAF
jgi:hypothetical protein